MYQALPYKSWHTSTQKTALPLMNNLITTSSSKSVVKIEKYASIKNLVDENTVIIFGKRGCCMNHVVRRLLHGLGVNPVVHEVDETEEQSVVEELKEVGPTGRTNSSMSFPTVFIGGRWYGDLERVIATHITGELTPVLRDAGALWL